MTKQEFFDRALAGIRQQGKRAAKGGACYYRKIDEETGATLKCAVGHLIPDEIYDPDMTNYLHEIWDYYSRLREAIGEENYALAVDLQAAHDRGPLAFDEWGRPGAVKMSNFSAERQEELTEWAFAEVAADHGLTYARLPWNRPAKYGVPMVI